MTEKYLSEKCLIEKREPRIFYVSKGLGYKKKDQVFMFEALIL